ncbi:hypothetical protein N7471_004468 [Penicillium samsonianum]|uniref:uncharacterized protein n=1 Tax=Penicillium samsonianum TaxID=1882272 RepID=UPI002549A3C2|nr:uncharacterized protein N7471_004468 [Penicillium samsonianum]KAJ6137982.1 hypothetical protein N7471_004468 [Penicillium samsonianum]
MGQTCWLSVSQRSQIENHIIAGVFIADVGSLPINGKLDVTKLQAFEILISSGKRHISGPVPKRSNHRNARGTLEPFGIAPGALSYVITTYRNDDCYGESKSVNVWDNTCRGTNIFATKSVRVDTYGGRHQKATFFTANGCGAAVSARYAWWADGGDSTFVKVKCLKFDREIHAYGSVSS